MSSSPFHYRPDVDGLRAIAVLSVLAFHFSPARFPGGFIGVDIFFVISGYLITKLLLGKLRQVVLLTAIFIAVESFAFSPR